MTPQPPPTWNEPRAIARARERALRQPGRWQVELVFVLVVAGLVMGQWALATTRPDRTPPPWYGALAMGLGLGIFVVVLIPRLVAWCPSRISLGPGGIDQRQGNRRSHLPYGRIRAVAVDEAAQHRCLRLELVDGSEMVYGLDAKADAAAILAALQEKVGGEGQSVTPTLSPGP